MSVDNAKVKTGKVRLSYVNLIEPRIKEDGTDSYQVTLLIPKTDTVTLSAIKRAQTAAFEAEKLGKLKGKTFASIVNTLHDGDEEKDISAYPEYAGHMYISVSSRKPVPLFDIDGRKLDHHDADDRITLYSGCYAKAIINFRAFNSSGNKGVSGFLSGVKKVSDGEPLAGSVVTADDFEDGEDLL
jgi:hypothetical protein